MHCGLPDGQRRWRCLDTCRYFPLVVLASWALTVLLQNFPEVRQAAEEGLTQALTVDGLISPTETIDLTKIAGVTAGAGIVGIVALAITGLGWIDATIEGTRRMFGAMRRPRYWLVLRAEDFLWLLIVGAAMLGAIILSVGVRSLGQWLLEQLNSGHHGGTVQQVAGNALSSLLIWLALVGFYAYSWRRPNRRWPSVLAGALMATIGIAIMVEFAFLIVGRTLSNPVYGALAVAAAILLLLYFASAIVLYFACWIAIGEGAPRTREEDAYYARVAGGSVLLPTELAAGSDASGDSSDG